MSTLAKVCEVLACCTAPDVPTEAITSEATLASLGIDSLDRIEAIMSLEGHFEIEIAHAEAEACATVRDLVNLVDRKVAEKGATE